VSVKFTKAKWYLAYLTDNKRYYMLVRNLLIFTVDPALIGGTALPVSGWLQRIKDAKSVRNIENINSNLPEIWRMSVEKNQHRGLDLRRSGRRRDFP
jgi:hypothetical protein